MKTNKKKNKKSTNMLNKKWYQRKEVQVAIVTTIGVIAVASINKWKSCFNLLY